MEKLVAGFLAQLWSIRLRKTILTLDWGRHDQTPFFTELLLTIKISKSRTPSYVETVVYIPITLPTQRAQQREAPRNKTRTHMKSSLTNE